VVSVQSTSGGTWLEDKTFPSKMLQPADLHGIGNSETAV
jgi:hypothetical protein